MFLAVEYGAECVSQPPPFVLKPFEKPFESMDIFLCPFLGQYMFLFLSLKITA